MATQYTAGIVTGQKWTAAIANQIGAAWETWTPTVTQSGSVTCTVTYAKYAQIQKLVVASAYLTVTGTGTANNPVLVSLPLTAQTSIAAAIGSGFIYDSSAAQLYTLVFTSNSSTTTGGFYTNASGNQWGVAPNIALAVSDQIRFQFVYEAA